MSDTPKTIRLEVTKGQIEADFAKLVRHLAAAATQGVLLGNWSGVVANMGAAAGTVWIKQSEGPLAWQLLLTGIGEALTELADGQPPTLINKGDADIIAERVGREAADLVIPVDFLDHPWSLPPVELAKKTLLAWLSPPPASALQPDLGNLGRRFDSALVLGLHRAIRRDEARYRPLLALREDPTGPAWQVLEDWRLYRAQLVADFRAAAVFDESFALDQIYVPLNAWHWVTQDADVKEEAKKCRAVVRLKEDMLAWLSGRREDGRLRLVSGGPGSGKSSEMKALAAELTEKSNNGESTDVLLFPLQRFQWRAGIIESVAATLTVYADQMRENPLSPNHLRDRKVPLLLIFDGLDEVTVNTAVSEAISATFLRELTTALRTWNGRPVWAIVTGRDAIFGNVEGPTTGLPGKLFHLLPYHVREQEPYAPDRSEYQDPEGLLQVDGRLEAVRLFADAKGQSLDTLRHGYSADNLHDVSAQPLLNYFLLTSGPDEVGDGNVARLYSRLFERLHARNRNMANRLQDAGKPGAGLSQEQFDKVFEAMAVAAWRTGGARAASWDEVLREADREDTYLRHGEQTLRDIFDSHMREHGAQKPFRLAAAFFVRNQQATGVEFTHKSFGDYLYARRLVKALAVMVEELRLTTAVEPEMLRRWEALTADQRMSHEVRRFLELEVKATVDAKALNSWHDILAPVVERVFRDGWRVDIETRGRHAEQRSSQMEEALFVAWHALWRPDSDRRYWRLGDDTGDLLYRGLARQGGAHGLHCGSVFVHSWSGADLSRANLSGVNLAGANLANANLRVANLRGANLAGADLAGADLAGANLDGAKLKDADLETADLTAANLEMADLRKASLVEACLNHANLWGANLWCADLEEANLRDAHLKGANLEMADLKCANLADANLAGANLSHAGLSDANLEMADLSGALLVGAWPIGANLRRANLCGANLCGADLLLARLRDANLEGANLEGANLEGANLEGANLEGANLEGANLKGANLERTKGSRLD